MSNPERMSKVSKVLRLKAQEFLSSGKYTNNLVDIMRHFESGADLTACLLTLEYIFTNLLKARHMFVEIVPLKPLERTRDMQYKQWLRYIYGDCFNKILTCCETSSIKIQIQALTTAMSFVAYEGKYPLDSKNSLDSSIPLSKLKAVIMKILSTKQNTIHLINKFDEYLSYDDILYFTWKILPSMTAKSNPNDIYIGNFLMLLGKMHVEKGTETKILCCVEEENLSFTFDQGATKRSLNKIWNCIMLWEHTPDTHRQLLMVLLEKVLPHLEKPLLLTDFLMDSLDITGPVSILALHGIYTMIQTYNLDYPNIFAKLYSMFEPEIFHTKFKARLFYLSDKFLSSTHLPESLVAAFAKRLARLTLVAPSNDIIIICFFIGNLIIRHPGLKCLLNYQVKNSATTDPSIIKQEPTDPYIMDERDPLKANAINSSLWEIQSLQKHVVPDVATAARFINSPLPSTEWDITKMLDNIEDDKFDKEIKKMSKLIVLSFERPIGASNSKGDKVSLYWNL